MEEQFMERVVKFLKDAEVFYFKNATATFSAFTHDPKVVKLGQKLWMINFKAQKNLLERTTILSSSFFTQKIRKTIEND